MAEKNIEEFWPSSVSIFHGNDSDDDDTPWQQLQIDNDSGQSIVTFRTQGTRCKKETFAKPT